ncbi:hypothetical protein DY000_02046484 [Brassica cretica]|uniref:Uncharacterized protein n=1 Tax=Brassica cretica TaxID=69181 RepID=A0ABQ7ENA2_BRACR|nr:hypothetical protein DY000_02046484 [Brassica cretica]
MCGSSVMTELGSSVFRSSYSDLSVTGLDILVFCGDLEVNFVVTVFDPNKHHTPALSPGSDGSGSWASWGQLKISSTQLGGVLWSGPVWSGHGRLWARPKGEEEQLDGYIRKGAKGTVLCPFPLTDCAGFLRAKETKRARDWRLEKRTVGVGVVLPARSDRGKARGLTWIPDRRKRRKRRSRTCLQGKEHPRTENTEPMPWPDQTWTVVKERYREDSGHGKMCGEWVIINKCEGTRKSKSQKDKEAAGTSGPVGGDETNPTQVLPTQTGLVNNETGEPLAPILTTEVHVDNLGEQRSWDVRRKVNPPMQETRPVVELVQWSWLSRPCARSHQLRPRLMQLRGQLRQLGQQQVWLKQLHR